MKEDILEMTQSDRKRLHIIKKVGAKEIKQRKAAELLDVSVRQIKRLLRGFRRDGDISVIHKLRKKPSNNRMDPEIRSRVIELYLERYEGFGPKLATEKLDEDHGIELSDETLRNWLKEERIAYPSRRARPHRSWRKRKSHRGEMIQLDGSHHDWLEGRDPWLVLMSYIDDATNEVFARFYDEEETLSAMDSFKRYIGKNGLPCSLYVDRHGTYKVASRPLTVAEQLEGMEEPMSNFQRALKELQVELIYAYSPQAKGRIERLFRTLQDRLVKELRLRGIRTKAEANKFLSSYLPRFNRKFRVPAENNIDLHRAVPQEIDLRSVLSIREYRVVKNDFTVQFDGRFYQIKDRIKTKKITVEKWLDSSLHFRYESRDLRCQEIHPVKREKVEGPGKTSSVGKVNPPSKDSPWRQFVINPARIART